MMAEKVAGLIFDKPEKWTHIREAARKLKISPNTVRKSVSLLKRQGIIEERKEGSMVLFRANLDSDEYKHKKMLQNLQKIYDSEVVEFLFKHYSPKAIVLFGSYARGEDVSSSDVDIGVVTSNAHRPNLSVFEKKIGRRIELYLFTKAKVSDEFFNNIINGIVLKGVLKNE